MSMLTRSLAFTFVIVACLSAAGWSTPQRNVGRRFVVATDGRPTNDGSAEKPWDLATAFGHPDAVQAGDEIWIRGGIYPGPFTSRLTGRPDAPIVLRGYPGERVTLDGRGTPDTTLSIHGSGTWYRDFEVTDSDALRIVSAKGSHPGGAERGDGIAVFGPQTKLINLVVHDAGDGIALWSPAIDSEVYGCIVYNNGWVGPDRAHGHGLYIQNEQGTKRIADVISFNNFVTGMKAYAESTGVSNVKFQGIVAFNNGSLAAGSGVTRETNLFVGTTRHAAAGIELTDSVLYYPPETETGANLELGYTSDLNQDLLVHQNQIVGGNRSFRMLRWRRARVDENVFYAASVGSFSQRLVTLEVPVRAEQYVWDRNAYFQTGASPPFIFQSRTMTFSGWQQSSGLDARSVYTTARPTGVQVFVRRNEYQRARAHIVVLNWDLRPDVTVDLSDVGLLAGQEFDIRDAQDLYGPPVLAGRYNSMPVTIAMRPRRPADAVGNVPGPVPHTAPQFAVFVVAPPRVRH